MSRNSNASSIKLTPRQLFEGIQVVSNNAKSLYEDALLLLEARRYPRAASLAILSIEELGKALLLAFMALTDDDKELNKLWNDFQNHISKNFPGVYINRFLAGDKSIREFRLKMTESARELNNIKKHGFYVDPPINDRWLAPTDIIAPSVAQYYVQIAGGLQIQGLTFEIFELFIEHLSPIWRADYESKKQSILQLVRKPGVPEILVQLITNFLGDD